MADSNFVNCPSCGTTYRRMGGVCPCCGEKVKSKTPVDTFFKLDKTVIYDYIRLIVAVFAFAAINLVMGAYFNTGRNYYSEKLDYYTAYEQSAGEYAVMDEQHYRAVAECQRGLSSTTTMMTMCAVFAAMAVISNVLLLLRLRLSFRIQFFMVISITVILAVMLVINGIMMKRFSALLPLIGAVAFNAGAVTKRCMDMSKCFAEADVIPDIEPKDTTPEFGAEMPKAQEVYSFEDMFGDSYTAPEPLYDASEALTEAPEPIMSAPEVPQVKADVGSCIDEDGANVAVTPLSSPMFDVSSMSDECMPNAAPPTEDTSPDAERKPVERLWFCPLCGSLNELVSVCQLCGAEKK